MSATQRLGGTVKATLRLHGHERDAQPGHRPRARRPVWTGAVSQTPRLNGSHEGGADADCLGDEVRAGGVNRVRTAAFLSVNLGRTPSSDSVADVRIAVSSVG
ncbi:hypothetical protein GCM10011591_30470 [Nocardia camponoti]|uniref:Uncharacterized protein n=1 Tax=Nocardia camponoti TaxID=1616106 RepID=A0A917QM84_9NOCA|nr:hypothetical protein GCM10011591_30470 [Nocardia camponoti]